MTPINIEERTQPVWPNNPRLLLHPNIPAGAAGLNPRTLLGKEWWDATRKSAEEANNHCCYACGIHKSDTKDGWLEGHEVYTMDYKELTITYGRTVSLCKLCHSFVHSGLLLNRLVSNEIDEADYVTTVITGVLLLRTIEEVPTFHQVYHMFMGSKELQRQVPKASIEAMLDELPRNLIDEVQSLILSSTRYPKQWKLIFNADVFTYDDLRQKSYGGSSEEGSH